MNIPSLPSPSETSCPAFDKNRFNQFLESKVGEDLAWIRINGAIVGASIGLCVFWRF